MSSTAKASSVERPTAVPLDHSAAAALRQTISQLQAPPRVMTVDNTTLAAELDRFAADARRLGERARQLDSRGDVIDSILAGELLTLEQAADIAGCSDEKIRRACEQAAAAKDPIGVKVAGRWLVGKTRLLDLIERGKLDGRRGREARLRAEERAAKYEGWARPQAPLLPVQEA
jgi:hypothetical protein